MYDKVSSDASPSKITFHYTSSQLNIIILHSVQCSVNEDITGFIDCATVEVKVHLLQRQVNDQQLVVQ